MGGVVFLPSILAFLVGIEDFYIPMKGILTSHGRKWSLIPNKSCLVGIPKVVSSFSHIVLFIWHLVLEWLHSYSKKTYKLTQ